MGQSFLITALIIFLTSGSVAADSIEHYLEILGKHPSVQRLLQEKEALQFQAEGAMGLPDPVLSLGVENIPITDPSFDQYLPSSKSAGFSQNIPNPTQRRAQSQVFTESAQQQYLVAGYARSRLQALFLKKVAEYERIKTELELEEQKRNLVETLKQYYKGEVVAGEPLLQKTFDVELDFSEIEKRQNDLLAEKKIVESVFVQLVGEIPELSDKSLLEKVWSGDVNDLYPVRIAVQNYSVVGQQVEVASAAFKPDFGFSAIYKNREEGEDNSFDGDDWFSLQVRMTVPLWGKKNQEPKLAAVKSRQRSALYNLEDVKRSWKAQMINIISKKEASQVNIKILENKKEALEKSIESLKNTYATGQTSLEPTLRAEIERLSLLARIAKENEMYWHNLQEANAHIFLEEYHHE